RICYVGITRAKEHLMITGARMRMTRGETQYNKVSRFVKEIPPELLEGDVRTGRREPKRPVAGTEFPSKVYRGIQDESGSAAQAGGRNNAATQLRGKKNPYSASVSRQFGSAQKLTSLDYGEGDRVRHMKFGEGTVMKIVSGGRDFEVSVDFDQYGIKKMFASFAKLRKL
ncbi:MAG: ATP-dependent DNA helicase PcrA, partial [Clostridiales bacterium]|nr:ATP-dependent DNA helicase PcrA [Clostridiales bacterium]